MTPWDAARVAAGHGPSGAGRGAAQASVTRLAAGGVDRLGP